MIANSSKVLEGTWRRQSTGDSLEDDLAYS
jgi:hypothetical protein